MYVVSCWGGRQKINHLSILCWFDEPRPPPVVMPTATTFSPVGHNSDSSRQPDWALLCLAWPCGNVCAANIERDAHLHNIEATLACLTDPENLPIPTKRSCVDGVSRTRHFYDG